MGTEKPAPTLPSIRTLAKDQARSQQGTTKPATPQTSAIPNENIAGAGESRTYQAPTWNKKPVTPPKETPVEDVSAKQTPPASTLKPLVGPKKIEETTIVVDNEEAASATIIRDTKHNRFQLFPAIEASLRSWFADLKKRYFTKKAPKYTVPETTRRKGVIQKATSKTGKINTFDSADLHTRIKEREVKATPKEPVTVWTANTEPGFPLLEAPDTTPVVRNVQVVPRKSFRTEARADVPPPTIKPEIKKDEVPAVVPPPQPVAAPRIIVASETEPIIDTPPATPERAPVAPPTPPALAPEPPPALTSPAPEPSPVVEQPAVASTIPRSAAIPPRTLLKPSSLREWIFTINTNLIALGVASVVLVAVIVGLISYRVISQNIATLEVTTVPNHQTYIDAPLQTLTSSVTPGSDLTSFLLANQKESAGRLLLFAFATDQTGATLQSPQTVLLEAGFAVSTPFARSLTAVYFGKTAGDAPFILLRTTDNTTALGGMLNWEAELYADLLPLFTASTGAQSDSADTAVFKDTVINGTDARALVDADGKIYLVYNLPFKNTIFITANTETLSTLLSLIKP